MRDKSTYVFNELNNKKSRQITFITNDMFFRALSIIEARVQCNNARKEKSPIINLLEKTYSQPFSCIIDKKSTRSTRRTMKGIWLYLFRVDLDKKTT